MTAPVAIGTVTVTSVADGRAWVLALVGDHDQSTELLLAQQTRRPWPPRAQIVVDLSAATLIDSSVIRWLLRMRRALAATGHPPLRVIAAPPGGAAARVFGLLSPGLREALGCVSTLAEAIGEDAAVVFDRVGERAWKLAAAIVDDACLADEIVVDTFTRRSSPLGTITVDDAALMCEVHQRARVAARTLSWAPDADRPRDVLAARRRRPIACATVRTAVVGLPEPQRTIVELAVFGGLTVTAVAGVVGVERIAVMTELHAGICAIRLAQICRHHTTAEPTGTAGGGLGRAGPTAAP